MKLLAADSSLNIPPDEHELLRSVTTDLAVLLRLIIEIKEYVEALNKNPPRSTDEKKKQFSEHLDEVPSCELLEDDDKLAALVEGENREELREFGAIDEMDRFEN